MAYDLLSLDIQYLKGVGPARAKMLNEELRIYTFRDLLYYFPYKYIDRSVTYRIADLRGGMSYVQIRGRILSHETEGEGRKRRLKAYFSDGTEVMELVWFQGIKYIEKQLRLHTDYVVLGKPVEFNMRISMSHPDLSLATNDDTAQIPLQPFYNTTEKMKRGGLTSESIHTLVKALLEKLTDEIPETLPMHVVADARLMPLDRALRLIHHPSSSDRLPEVRHRLKFEELFFLQLDILRYARNRQKRFRGFVFNKVGDYFHRFFKEILPFELTEAQKRVMREIRADVATDRQMNRLLQGDVGSGKTLVAVMTMLLACDNGFQACLMAPTEILAEQHYDGISRWLVPLGLRVELLTGMVKGKRRTAILEDLERGHIHILIGTHALIEAGVRFSNLGMAVIDEQHRFGVKQRAMLWAKNTTPPHVLVMTATPIPRTLAMTVYGDLDVSVIDSLPPGRKPIKTLHYYEDKASVMYSGIRSELTKGRQVYVVYPLIKENEKMDLISLEEGFERITAAFPEYKADKLHGKMKSSEKDEAMSRFVSGETHILVSTTVIEVGVNVPNASVMIIESASRFGLSQLHQLRGRVGRGAEQSYCILVTGYKIGENVKRRIQIMLESTDGFEIAEEDMKLRGPGDMEGTQQSGMPFELKIANLAQDGQVLTQAREQAQKVLALDPDESLPTHESIWKQLSTLRASRTNWSSIS